MKRRVIRGMSVGDASAHVAAGKSCLECAHAVEARDGGKTCGKLSGRPATWPTVANHCLTYSHAVSVGDPPEVKRHPCLGCKHCEAGSRELLDGEEVSVLYCEEHGGSPIRDLWAHGGDCHEYIPREEGSPPVTAGPQHRCHDCAELVGLHISRAQPVGYQCSQLGNVTMEEADAMEDCAYYNTLFDEDDD